MPARLTTCTNTQLVLELLSSFKTIKQNGVVWFILCILCYILRHPDIYYHTLYHTYFPTLLPSLQNDVKQWHIKNKPHCLRLLDDALFFIAMVSNVCILCLPADEWIRMLTIFKIISSSLTVTVFNFLKTFNIGILHFQYFKLIKPNSGRQ